MADAIQAEIEALAQQVADLEGRTSGTPEAEAVRARVMARLEQIVGQVEKEFPQEPAAAKAACPHSDNTLRQAFDIYDADKSGFLENDEIIALAQKLGANKEVEELKAAIKDMDTSNDGKVSFDEFAVFIRSEGASGKIATKLRAKLLKGKLGEQLTRIKSVANKASAKSSSPPEGVERQFDVAVTVGGMQPEEETAVRGDFQVTATPRAEIPEGEYDMSLTVTLTMKEGQGEGAVAACIEQMTGIYNMMAGGMPLKGFEAQQVDGKLVVVIKGDPEDLAGLLDKMVFFNGAPGAASLQATGKVRTNIDYEKLVTATLDSPYDITQSGKAAFHFIATVSNDTWFENLVNTIQGAGEDSDDEGEGGTAEEKFAKLPFFKKVQKKVMPKLAWWMSGLRARFAFASVSEFLGKFSQHGPKQAKILSGWTKELAQYQLAKKFCDDGPPPEEPYVAITGVVGGLIKMELGIKAGHGDFNATVDYAGLERITELLPSYEMCEASARGDLVKPGVPALA